MMSNITSLSSFQFNKSCAPLVEKLCEPLFNSFGITHFGCIRILENGQMLRITNNKKWTKDFFQHEFYNDIDLYGMKDASLNDPFYVLLNGAPNSQHLSMLCSEFNIWNFMLIYERFETYRDLWFFGTERSNYQIINFYVNNLNVLQHFILHFKHKAAHLFDITDSSKLISTKIRPLSTEYKEKKDIHDFLDKISYNKHALGGNFCGKYLSKREAECLFYFSQGRSMKEIANHIGLTPKTIETYVNNIKNKIGCHTKGELISMFSKLNIPYI